MLIKKATFEVLHNLSIMFIKVLIRNTNYVAVFAYANIHNPLFFHVFIRLYTELLPMTAALTHFVHVSGLLFLAVVVGVHLYLSMTTGFLFALSPFHTANIV